MTEVVTISDDDDDDDDVSLVGRVERRSGSYFGSCMYVLHGVSNTRENT
jgi:hypothetical protein